MQQIKQRDIPYYYCHKCLREHAPSELISGHTPCCHADYGVSHWTLSMYEEDPEIEILYIP